MLSATLMCRSQMTSFPFGLPVVQVIFLTAWSRKIRHSPRLCSAIKGDEVTLHLPGNAPRVFRVIGITKPRSMAAD